MRIDGPAAQRGSWGKYDVVRVFKPHSNLLRNPACRMKKKAYIIIANFPNGQFRKLRDELRQTEESGNIARINPIKRTRMIDIDQLPLQARMSIANPPHVVLFEWDVARKFILRDKLLFSQRTIEQHSGART